MLDSFQTLCSRVALPVAAAGLRHKVGIFLHKNTVIAKTFQLKEDRAADNAPTYDRHICSSHDCYLELADLLFTKYIKNKVKKLVVDLERDRLSPIKASF